MQLLTRKLYSGLQKCSSNTAKMHKLEDGARSSFGGGWFSLLSLPLHSGWTFSLYWSLNETAVIF